MKIKDAATNHKFRAVVSIEDLKASPATPIGIVPIITYHPILASGFDL
jgi:hypothetical protein